MCPNLLKYYLLYLTVKNLLLFDFATFETGAEEWDWIWVLEKVLDMKCIHTDQTEAINSSDIDLRLHPLKM